MVWSEFVAFRSHEMNVHMGDLVQSIGNVMDFYPNLKGLIDVKCRDSI